jgi:REP element-mobilizing transposase RayT
MIGILNNLNCNSLIINGVADHVHILCQLSRTIAVANLLKELKASSSSWIKTKSNELQFFQWQAGYGAFSVSQSNVEAVTTYIEQQETHHSTMSYQEEYRELCRRHSVEIDERYVWD